MPESQKTKRTVQKIVFFIVAILLLLLVVLGVSGYRYFTSSLEPLNPNSEEAVEVEIPMGSSRADIARILEENNIIKSAFVFNMYIRMNEEQGFQAGYYEFSPSMEPDEIIDNLQEGGAPVPRDSVANITVPEGITVEQIVGIISEHTEFSEDDLFSLLDNTQFLQEKASEFPRLLTSAVEAQEETIYTFEGYLFPATYDYYEGMTADELITAMLDKTNDVLSEYYEDIEEQEKTVHEVLTMSSLIEREAIEDEDRQLISGVFVNRLEAGMPLQTDVSVTYALEEHKERITYADLETDSPYNLYQHTGIGPGPVNNGSESSIQASLYPAETDYYYFLADLDTREVYFSETYDQHLQYKSEYLD